MRPTLRAYGALGVLALLMSTGAAAQGVPIPPPPGRREITTIDFSPNGGWRVKARKVMAARRIALAQRDFRALNTPGITPVLEGDLRIPVVFVAFADTSVADTTPVIGDTAKFHGVFFSTNPTADVPARPYSLKTYYEELSNGHLKINGHIYGWITTPFTYAAVGHNCAAVFAPCTSTQIHAGLGAMLRAALDSLNTAGHQVDWGQFDNDGPDSIPNSGDDDGIVDFVTFIHPDLGGECGGAGGGQTGNHIWAHRWTMSAVSGSQYTTATPRHGGGFIRIEDYTIQSARGGNSACTAGSIMPIGTLAHETGHTFGIPDLYCITNGCPSEGLGEWSLMASGNYVRPESPARWDGWSLAQMGWVSVGSLTSSGTVTLGPVQTSDSVLIARITGTDQYLLLENRQALESDSAQMDPSVGSRQKMPGLVIYQVDSSIVVGGLPSNTVNSGPTEGVRILQADGLGDLQLGHNRGDLGDSYPGSSGNRLLGPSSNPAARTNEGSPAGFIIDSIYQVSANGPMVFRFTADTVPVPVAVSYDQATSAILGVTSLTGPQATYLDQVGNNNGLFDLGDYLAYLKANGLVLAPSLLTRITAVHSLAPSKEH